MKGDGLKKHSMHGNTAVSVLLKIFISGRIVVNNFVSIFKLTSTKSYLVV